MKEPSGLQNSTAMWRGKTPLTKLLAAYCRFTPQFPGKRHVYEWCGSRLFRNGCVLQNGNGVQLNVDPTDYIGRMMLFEGNYEPQSIALAQRLMSSGGVFVDVGCNFGLYTLSIGKIPGVRTIAIDASFVALTKLGRNLELNPDITAEIVNCAASSDSSIQCFDVPERTNLGTTKVADKTNTNGSHSSSRFWTVGTTLQHVFDRLKLDRIRLLKIDVEGFETEVFKGLDFSGPYRPENLIVECDLEFPGTLPCFEFLLSKGYQSSSVDGKPIRDCRNLLEHNVWFHNANAR